jgi:hypothetical protein
MIFVWDSPRDDPSRRVLRPPQRQHFTRLPINQMAFEMTFVAQIHNVFRIVIRTIHIDVVA